MESKIIERAMPNANSPFVLSNAIAVVNVLVNPLMFPPSINAIPISELTLEKAARITANTS